MTRKRSWQAARDEDGAEATVVGGWPGG